MAQVEVYGMVEKIRASEAKAHFSALLARAGYGGERFLIERRGKPLAALVGVEDLRRLEMEARGVSLRPRGALALVGAWADADEGGIDGWLDEIYTARERDTGREVDLEF